MTNELSCKDCIWTQTDVNKFPCNRCRRAYVDHYKAQTINTWVTDVHKAISELRRLKSFDCYDIDDIQFDSYGTTIMMMGDAVPEMAKELHTDHTETDHFNHLQIGSLDFVSRRYEDG